MTRLYTKTHDEKIVPIDFIKSRDVADGRIVFSVDDNHQHITYYFCQKQNEENGSVIEWRFYPISFLVGQPMTTEQYFIYDFNAKKLNQSSSPPSKKQRPQLDPKQHASFLTDAEKNKILLSQTFHPIMQAIKSMQLKMPKNWTLDNRTHQRINCVA